VFAQLAVEGLDELESRFAAAQAAAGSSANDGMIALGTAYLDYAAQNPELFDLMFGAGGGLVDLLAPEIVEARARVWQRLLDTVWGSAAGLGDGVAAEVLAGAAWSTVHGLATWRRSGIGPDAPGLSTEELLRIALTSIRNS